VLIRLEHSFFIGKAQAVRDQNKSQRADHSTAKWAKTPGANDSVFGCAVDMLIDRFGSSTAERPALTRGRSAFSTGRRDPWVPIAGWAVGAARRVHPLSCSIG
jgi:hypothetical protein